MKPYVKPEIHFEEFELSTHIATCSLDMSNSASKDSCSATGDSDCGFPENVQFFTGTNDKCNAPIEDYCYTNGSGGFNIFNS